MNSEIILVKNMKIDKNYNNVLSYSESDMLSLCRTNAVATSNTYSFIRGSKNIISTDFSYTDCLKSNYIAFQNPDYNNKWIFAFIDEVIYRGNFNIQLRYTIDVWSTWFSYWTPKPCYVIRHHVNDDTIGANTVDENLNVGEVIEEHETEDDSYSNEYGYWISISSNWRIKDGSTGNELNPSDKGTQNQGITVYNNVVFGSEQFLFKITDTTDFIKVGLFLLRTNADGHIEDVKNIFIVPSVAISENTLTLHSASVGGINFSFYTMPYTINPETFNTEITKRHSFSDYTPKNNKCFVYPYNYLYVTNNQGSNNIFKYELFSTNKCVFENQFAFSIGGSGRIVPKNYKNMPSCEDESLALGKYPVCEWSSDAYINWLTKNGVNFAVGLGLTAGTIATSFLTAGATTPVVASATMTVAQTIGKNIGNFVQASLLPNISGGQPTGDIAWSTGRNIFTFKEMRVKTEFLKMIDDYFSRYGYKILRCIKPNITGRSNWNYVEIAPNESIGYSSSNICSVPSEDMEQINKACQKGITIWHNHANIGNYNLSNAIV